jgi:DNA-binding transcriptional MerR regulator
MQLFTMKAAAQMSGLTEHTLRAWERRYGAVRPVRTPTGRRLFSGDEVERLTLLARVTSRGNPISVVAGLPLEALRNLERQTRPPGAGGAATAGDGQVAELRDAVERFALDRLAVQLAAARSTLGARTFVLEVAAPLMQAVGREVAAGHWSIAQEHMVSAVLRDQLGALYAALAANAPAGGPGIAFAVRERDLHEFGILLGAVLAAAHGLRTAFLGANLPATEIAEGVRRSGAGVLVLGIVPVPESEGVPPLEAFAHALDAGLPGASELWVGGSAEAGEPPAPAHRVQRRYYTLAELDEALAGLR